MSDKELQKIWELGDIGLNIWSKFSCFAGEDSIMFILNHIEDDHMMLEKPYLISKEVISTISSLYDFGPIPVKKSIKNK